MTSSMSCSTTHDREPELVAQADDEVHQRARLGGVEAAGRLVEQQQPRLPGQRPRHLQPLLAAERQAARLHVRDVAEARRAPAARGPRSRAAASSRRTAGSPSAAPSSAAAQPRVLAHQHVVEGGERLEDLGVLEGAADAAAGDLVRRQPRAGRRRRR